MGLLHCRQILYHLSHLGNSSIHSELNTLMPGCLAPVTSWLWTECSPQLHLSLKYMPSSSWISLQIWVQLASFFQRLLKISDPFLALLFSIIAMELLYLNYLLCHFTNFGQKQWEMSASNPPSFSNCWLLNYVFLKIIVL